MNLTRREFLIRAGQLGSAVALSEYALRKSPSTSASGMPLAQQEIPGKEDMVVYTTRPFNLGTKLQYQRTFITPNKHFYVRNHYGTPGLDLPAIDINAWRLIIEGEVDNPLILTFDDLKRFEPVTLTTWLQCFGNGRSFFDPPASGTPWRYDSIAQAVWKGVRLRDVLLAASPKVGAKHVASQGHDDPPSGAEPFIRSIPLEKAIDPNTLLVYEMNGEPLPILNGFPVRLLVPGWGGSASVKWLKRIIVLKEEWSGRFMQRAYRIPAGPVEPGATVDLQDMITATRQPVNSFLTSHAGGETVPAGTVLLTGVAYSGETGIERVEVSVDGGQTWRPATIVRPGPATPLSQAALLWYQWACLWDASPGQYVLQCRAFDWLGRTQPTTQRDIPWNPLGYNYNKVQSITVTVQ